MFFARFANLRVWCDSLKESDEGEIIAIMVVLQFPPSESSSSLVSFESRKGMCVRGLLSVRAEITFPRAERDWLIFFASSSR